MAIITDSNNNNKLTSQLAATHAFMWLLTNIAYVHVYIYIYIYIYVYTCVCVCVCHSVVCYNPFGDCVFGSLNVPTSGIVLFDYYYVYNVIVIITITITITILISNIILFIMTCLFVGVAARVHVVLV